MSVNQSNSNPTNQPAVDFWAFSQNADITKVNTDFVKDAKSIREFLKRKFGGGYVFGIDNLTGSGIYKVMGIAFDFRPFLKEFFVEEYGQISKHYGLSKTALRRALHLSKEARFFAVQEV